MAVGVQPRELTAEKAEGQLLDLLPFCRSSQSDEAHWYLLLYTVSGAKLSTIQDSESRNGAERVAK